MVRVDLIRAVLAVENALSFLGLGQTVAARLEFSARMELDLSRIKDVLHIRKVDQVHDGFSERELVNARVPDVDGDVVV